MSKWTLGLSIAAVAAIVGGAAYAAGFAAGRAETAATPARWPAAQPVQAPNPFLPPDLFAPAEPVPAQPRPGQLAPGPVPFQTVPQPQTPGQPPTMREFIPIPGPGDQTPGQRPGQQSGECEPIILFYHNGQLFQLRPGQGPQDGQGRPGVPPEFFYLNPYQGPPIPGLPMPRPDRGPGFAPVNPRS